MRADLGNAFVTLRKSLQAVVIVVLVAGGNNVGFLGDGFIADRTIETSALIGIRENLDAAPGGKQKSGMSKPFDLHVSTSLCSQCSFD
jgi:hypothetical protein